MNEQLQTVKTGLNNLIAGLSNLNPPDPSSPIPAPVHYMMRAVCLGALKSALASVEAVEGIAAQFNG